MATTHKLISSVTVGAGGAANIEFTSIPQTYTDLVILFSGRSNRAAYFDNVKIMPNGATTGVSTKILWGTGAAVQSFNEASLVSAYTNGSDSTASVFGNSVIYIPNYAGSTTKTFSMNSVSENNGTNAAAALSAGLWTGTSAITSITLDQGDGTTWSQYSTAYLYGIKSS